MYTKVENNENKKNKGFLSEFKDNFKYIQVTYDLNFIKYEVFVAIICMVFFGIIIALGYKMPFVDPIGKQKSIFLSIQIILSVVSVLSIAVVAKFTKLKDALLRNFLVLATLLLVSIFTQVLYLGSISKEYNEIKFGEFYEQYENVNSESNRTKLALSSQGITNSTAKEDYIKTSISSYKTFVIRGIVLILLQVIIFGFSLYILYKLMNTTEKLSVPIAKATV